jgi:hypothetical protein
MNRKYRHRGYRDSESEDAQRREKPPPRQTLTPEEKLQRKSMRHAIDRDAHAVVRCHKCGRNVQDFGTITGETLCPHCAAPMHCCRICRHFDSAARWQCRAEITEPVGDKTRANACSSFEPRLVLDVTGRRTTNGRSDDPRAAFESLFKR